MPQIIKLDNFTNDETTENKYGKFEKIFFKKSMKLEDLNKNGHIKIEYDVNNNPYFEISADDKKTVLTNSSIHVNNANVDKIVLKGDDLEDKLSKLTMKLEYLEKKSPRFRRYRKSSIL